MAKFRKLLYAKTVQDYETEMEAFLNDPFVRKYEKFFAHLRKNYFVEKWSMHVRNDLKLPTNNNQTNILCESSFRVLKDILFQRIPISSQIMLVCVLVMGVSQMQCITVQQLRSQSAHTDK